MAGRILKPVQGLHDGDVEIVGRFVPDSTTSGCVENTGNGVDSITVDANGRYTLNLTDVWARELGSFVDIKLPNVTISGDIGVNIDTVDLTNKEVKIKVWQNSSDNEVHLASAEVSFLLKVSNNTTR